jgi:energy-coupling factor transporter ATP-binding protein EcfA2
MTDWISGGPAFDGLPTAGSAYDERLALLDAVRQLHSEVSRLALSPDAPGASRLHRARDGVLRLLEGYLVGRLQQGDRPLLAVIGGPTGAGKSTLLNSLVGATISPASVLRPTTRTPVLLYNPVDEQAVVSQHLLPGLELTSSREDLRPAGRGDPAAARRIRRVARPEVPPGLTVLDSPDLDSWLSTNTELAAELLGVADLWIFVTTGTDYANAVPWGLIGGVNDRHVTIAAVLNRMRPAEMSAVRQHFAQMLIERGLRSTPVFTVPELVLVDDRIPYDYVNQLSNWLARQSGVYDVRESYLDRALVGTLEQVMEAVGRLVDAVGEQQVAELRVRADLRAVFSHGREELRARVTSGVLSEGLRDAWRAVAEASHGGRLLRRLGAALRNADTPYAGVGSALRTSLIAIAGQHTSLALTLLAERWPGGPITLTPGTGRASLPTDFAARADTLVVAWLDGIEARFGVRQERQSVWSRWSPETVALATLVLTPGSTEADSLVAAARRTLADREIPLAASDVDRAQLELLARLDLLLAEEEGRILVGLDQTAASVDSDPTAVLRAHLDALERLKQTAFSD